MKQTSSKEYKTWDDYMGKVIPWERCKKFNFADNTKWYIHKKKHRLKHRLIKSKKTASSWQRKEAEGTPQKQLLTPTTPMT